MMEFYTDGVECGCDVLTHVCPVRAGAREVDLTGLGEEAFFGIGDAGHGTGAECATEEVDEVSDLAGGFVFDVRPAFGGELVDFYDLKGDV